MAKLLAIPEVMELLERRVALDYPELARGRTHLPMCLVVTETLEVLGLLVAESPEEEADYCAAAANLLLAKRQSSTSSPSGGRPQSVAVSASIGVMEWDARKVASCVEIELAAEQQMQRAKREGRNRVCAQAVPKAIPNEVTESVPQAIPNEVTGSVNDTARVEVTERHAA